MQFRHARLGLLLITTAAFAQDSVHTSVASGSFSGSAHFSAPQDLHEQVVAGAPYSAEENFTMIQTLADGTHITRTKSTRKLYRDSAGRTRTERALMQAPPSWRKTGAEVPVVVEITDPVEHVKYTLDTVNKIAHKQVIAPRERNAGRAAPRAAAAAKPSQPPADDAPQFTHEKLEDQTMEGLQVEGNRHTTVYPAGSEGNDRPFTAVSESWWSPELKLAVLSTDNDPRNGESTRKLVNVNRSEPDASLFLPPADYTVVEEKGDFTIKWGSESQ
jgi:hypothetical protein